MNIWMLSIASLFNDIASEATLRLIPLFLSQVLGASLPVIGLIEGVANATATLIKPLSGYVSDRLPRRKPLVVAGYALSGLTKPFLLFANHWSVVLLVRFTDRIGKGIRSAPRDAMIADESHAEKRGKNFGLNQMLDTFGALIGLLIAWRVLQGNTALTREGFRTVVLIAIIPATLAVLTVAFLVHEKKRALHTTEKHTSQPKLRALAALPRDFWKYLVIVMLFTLSNSSDAFLILKVSSTLQSGIGTVFLCLIAMNVSSTVTAMPSGALSDRFGRKKLIAAGWLVYALSYAGFGYASSLGAFLTLFFLYGVFYGFTEGTEKAFVADLVGTGRGLAYGAFALAVGLMSLPASLGFGFLYERLGPQDSFLVAAGLSLASAIALLVFVPEKKQS